MTPEHSRARALTCSLHVFDTAVVNDGNVVVAGGGGGVGNQGRSNHVGSSISGGGRPGGGGDGFSNPIDLLTPTKEADKRDDPSHDAHQMVENP